MTSAIYEGWVRHRRVSPRELRFKYRVFMPYLRLDELPELFDGSLTWSARRPAPARFRREDFLGDPALPLDESVRRRVAEETGRRPEGPIYLLANLRYFGFIMNPVSCYYCFDADQRLRYILVDVIRPSPDVVARASYRVLRDLVQGLGEKAATDPWWKTFPLVPDAELEAIPLTKLRDRVKGWWSALKR